MHHFVGATGRSPVLYPLREDFKPLLFEMGIKGKRGFDTERAQHLQAHAINQAEIAPSRALSKPSGDVTFGSFILG